MSHPPAVGVPGLAQPFHVLLWISLCPNLFIIPSAFLCALVCLLLSLLRLGTAWPCQHCIKQNNAGFHMALLKQSELPFFPYFFFFLGNSIVLLTFSS